MSQVREMKNRGLAAKYINAVITYLYDCIGA
jgi:hypothetical protein